MKQFLKDVLSENGQPSSKRWAFFTILYVFVGICIYNIITGKTLSPTLQDQLYYMLLALLGSVVGSNVLDTVKNIKTGTGPSNPPPPANPGS